MTIRTTSLLMGAAPIALCTGLILAPAAAQAACPSTADTTLGIFASTVGTNDITITTFSGGAVVVSADPSDTRSVGIQACADLGSIKVNLGDNVVSKDGPGVVLSDNGKGVTFAQHAGQIIAGGPAGDSGGLAIYQTGLGPVSVTTDAGTGISTAAGSNAILVDTSQGAITANLAGDVSEGSVLLVSRGDGDINAQVSGNIVSSKFVGLFANGGGNGDVTVAITGAITSAGPAVSAFTQGLGTTTVVADGNVNGAESGIDAEATASGDVVVQVGGSVTGLNQQGVIVVSNTGSAVVSVTGHVTGKTAGVRAESVGAGDVIVNAGASSDIASTGSTGSGIDANSNGGDVTITVQGSVSEGVFATTTLNGAVNVTSTGNIKVATTAHSGIEGRTANGLVHLQADGGAIQSVGGSALRGKTTGAGDIEIVTAAGSHQTSVSPGPDHAYAINAFAAGTGDVAMSLKGSVDDGGLFAQTSSGSIAVANFDVITDLAGTGAWLTTGSGPASLNNAGAITGTTTGVRAFSATGAVAVVNSGAITGGGAAGLDLTGPAGATVTNTSTGIIVGAGDTGDNAAVTAHTGAFTLQNAGKISTTNPNHKGVAIRAFDTTVTNIDNQAGGLIDGRVHGDNNVTFLNEGTWRTNGKSSFGNAKFESTNTLTNTGLIQGGLDGPSASKTSTITFANLGKLTNGTKTTTGVVSLINGREGDVLELSGAFKGTKGHSVLGLDAFLGASGSIADEFHVGGGTSGQTGILINDTNPGAGATNKAGITLVTGVSGKNDFVIDPTSPNYDAKTGGINHGFFLYELDVKGDEARLSSHPGSKGKGAPGLVSAVQSVWYTVENLLDGSASPATGFVDDAPRLWMNATNWNPSLVGGGRATMWENPLPNGGLTGGVAAELGSLDQQVTFEDFELNSSGGVGYRQRTASLMGGLDLVRRQEGPGRWVMGLAGGYVTSDQAFLEGQVAARYDGALAALYGRYTLGGLTLSGSLRADSLSMRYLSVRLAGDPPETRAGTAGLALSARYDLPLGSGWWLEPEANVAVSRTHMTDLVAWGGTVSFVDADSVRAGLGARLTGGGGWAGHRYDVSLNARVWREFEGSNGAILPGEAPELVTDEIGGTSAEFGGTLRLYDRSGHADAFIATDARMGAVADAFSLLAGARYRW